MTFFAKLTAAGAAAYTAAQSGSPVSLGTMAVGDANGSAYSPTGAETALVHSLMSVTIDSCVVDPTDSTVLIITAIFPAATGGFVMREAGVFTAGGQLFAIASLPSITKPDPDTSGAAMDFILKMKMRISGAANITVDLDTSAVYATEDWVWLNRTFFAVKSATTTAPPGSPAAGDQYLIPAAGATGAWAGQGNKIALWRNSLDGWLFIDPPSSARAAVAGVDTIFRRTGSGWTTAVDPAIDTMKNRSRLTDKSITGTYLSTTQATLTTSLVDLTPTAATAATPVSKVRTAILRFANIGAADANADLYVVDTGVGSNANDGYRAKNYPVPYNSGSSAPDFERKIVLTAGQKLQAKASAGSAVAVSVVWLEDTSGIFLPTTQRACTTSLQDIGPQGAATVYTPASKVRTAWVRFCNVGAADASADLYVVDTLVAANANDGYRAKNYPVLYNISSAAPDFEQGLVLTAGQKLQHKASASSAAAISIEWAEDNA